MTTCNCQALLDTEARRLLDAAERAKRRGDRRNADWAYRAAFGVARAIGVLRRAAR